MKLTVREIFNLKNVSNFIEGNINFFIENTSFFKLPTHIKEQAELRAKLCKPCLDAGACTECGCMTPEMFYASNKTCDKGLWSEMLGINDWAKWKEDYNYDPNNVKLDLAKIEVEQRTSSADELSNWERKDLFEGFNMVDRPKPKKTLGTKLK